MGTWRMVLESAIVERLTPIWRHVLKRPVAGLEDNFFDLGSDPAAAVELFKGIAEVFDRRLPPITIYQAPTLGKLASLLDHPELPAFPPVVLMKAGTDAPVFLTHGVGGSLMELSHLVKHLQVPNSCYGIQAQGFDGKSEPLSRVEDMAERYVNAIREVQPNGPYALIGYSFGGLVVFEMARQLIEAGEKVALLALVESYPHRSQLPFAIRIGIYPNLVKHHASILRGVPWQRRIPYLMRASERRVQAVRNHRGAGQSESDVWLFAQGLHRYLTQQRRAWRHYRPGLYKGKVNFLRAENQSLIFADNPTNVWARLADVFEVETVSGDHCGIVAKHCETLASVLSGHIKAAFQNK